ncbi:MAG: hypothetical protein WCS88_00620 [Patescibacteria group bacterium]|jgi:hypothetical protein
MFEHLGPTPEVSINRQGSRYSLYLSLLVMSVFVFIFSMSLGKGADSKAQEQQEQQELYAKLFVDPSDKKIVDTAKNFSIFDFVVEVNKPETSLYKLNITVEGVYDLEVIKDLKLFHEDVQLGEINQIDDNGKIYFDLAEYELKVGQNKFSLFFNNGDSLKAGLALKFSIEDRSDIFLITNSHVFKPQTDFPVSGGLVSILDKGQVMAANSNLITDFLISSDVPQQIGAFELSAIGEKIDLSKIKLSYQNLSSSTSDEQVALDFALIHNNELISEAVSNNNEIIFDLSQNIALQDTSREKFYLYTMGLPVDTYQFFVEDVKTQGVLSGVDISLSNKVALNKVEARSYFIQFSSGDLDQRLSEGWNKIYSLKIKTVGTGPAYLNKITWVIDKQNLDIKEIEIYKNGEPYIVDIILKDNQLIIKTDGLNPLKIEEKNTELQILANLVNIKPKAKLEAFILADKDFIDEETLSGNIIWSDGDSFYNGYKMPYLPLEPSILSN